VKCLTNEFISIYMVFLRAVCKAYSNEIDVPLWMETVFQEISISRHVSSLGLSDEMSISDGCSICHSVQNWAFNVGQVACENIYRHSLGSLLYSMANYHLYIFKVFISTILIT